MKHNNCQVSRKRSLVINALPVIVRNARHQSALPAAEHAAATRRSDARTTTQRRTAIALQAPAKSTGRHTRPPVRRRGTAPGRNSKDL